MTGTGTRITKSALAFDRNISRKKNNNSSKLYREIKDKMADLDMAAGQDLRCILPLVLKMLF